MENSSVVFVFLTIATIGAISFSNGNTDVLCRESERQALLRFKHDLKDPMNWLSTWDGEGDCCSWVGVTCDNLTGIFAKIRLEELQIRRETKSMSSHGNASTANDPRQPSAAKPFVSQSVAPQDLPVDYSGFIAVMFGVAGVMFRYKLCSWVAIIFCAQSLANMRNFETDLKQVSMAMMFAVMGLVTNYLGPRPQKTT